MKIPQFLQHLKTHGELPIPFSVYVDPNGKPDFRVIDRAKTIQCATEHLCFICGKEMVYGFWFIGGPHSMANRTFSDGPMHRRCAEYSIQTCPYLSGKKSHSDRPISIPNGHVAINETVIIGRPETMFMRRTTAYRLATVDGTPQGSLLFVVREWSGKAIEF